MREKELEEIFEEKIDDNSELIKAVNPQWKNSRKPKLANPTPRYFLYEH